jgi:hypothetical protein
MVRFHHHQPGVVGCFDPHNRILHVAYFGHVTAETTSAIYQWGWRLSEEVGPENIYGMIIDFSAVLAFAPQSVGTALRESRRINRTFDLSHLPVAHIVKNLYQEQMVTISTDLSGQPERMRLVYSEDEALSFIENWQTTQGKTG